MDAKRAARIESLLHTPGFDELRQELEEAEARFWKRHITDMKNGVAVEQRQLDRMLGRLDGIRMLLAQPSRAARILAKETKEEEQSEN